LTRFLLTLMLGVFIAVPVWGQQADEQADVADATEATELDAAEPAEEAVADVDAEAEAEVETEEFDEAGLDEQGFSDEDDDFRPSEVIPTDQSIDFPTDI
jgi:hypothetical protein